MHKRLKKKLISVAYRKLISLASNQTNEIRVTYTVPLKALNQILLGRSISFMSIVPKDRYIDVSKLKSFYQVNEMVKKKN